ncbi:hypothetical protein CPHO_05660 [Corynebacterium phocae]|uniref:Uncharacterized protein n=2 Tax=Corynebacterium phocae TaxID=161895 RepID=A0A1L7D6A6_9CORY|nr:hypothetical protein CPHO_05660 [Corynebacterium phocae]
MPAIISVGIVATLFEQVIVGIPWLHSYQFFTIGVLLAFAYSLLPIIVFRNEISRLEIASPKSWMLSDLGVLATLWFTPWIGAVAGLFSTRFAYIATLLLAVCVVLGSVLRTDTLSLLLFAQFIAQTALWTVFSGTRAQHLLFVLDTPTSFKMLLASILSLMLTALFLQRFKSNSAQD